MRTLCVECGPDVRIDEDGCCALCGGTAVGTWLDKIVKHATSETSTETIVGRVFHEATWRPSDPRAR